MAFPYPLIPSLQAERTEQLARLIYELLDAHTDTELLVRERGNELHWRAHLGYLRDLQRIGRELLAQQTDGSRVDGRSRRAGGEE